MAAADYDALPRVPANHVPLTPLLFVERAAQVFPDNTAVVHGATRRSYRDLRDRCVRLAHALHRAGIGRGDTVAALLPNIPAMLECHYGVPMTGGVLNTLNTRLDAGSDRLHCLEHGEAKALMADTRVFVPPCCASRAGTQCAKVETAGHRPCDDPEATRGERAPSGWTARPTTRPSSRAAIRPEYAWFRCPSDEWNAIALNYTSGTTGQPQGRRLSPSRRGYLLAISNIVSCRHDAGIRSICGRCRCSTATAGASHGRLPLQRRHAGLPAQGPGAGDHVAADGCAWRHASLCGAPIVMSTAAERPAGCRKGISATPGAVSGRRRAAAGSRARAAMKEAGFEVTHVYGLTETYGPAVVNDWHAATGTRCPQTEQAACKWPPGCALPGAAAGA